ncbi:MAG: flagellar basal body rod protein FlgB [Clostridiaceae bacterium]|jgi:flagellar basal-body rod protein FlgB|nr:flagellar basal body rod protein FlgB [Bacillota bacterium]NLI37906.1 flagellar basal body rod protein FlgB [Clostridiaceae bacterium]
MIPVLQNILFPKSNLQKALDASWLRNEVISNNIANVDTPGYKRKTVKFEEFLSSEMKTGKISKGQTRLKSSDIMVSHDYSTLSYRSDGNNVDIENEMAELATNSLRYNTLIQKMNGDFQNLRKVIRGGA